jgi:hypothetical protein
MSWSSKLSQVPHTIDGKTIKTLSDARAYAVALPANYSSRQHWQHAAKLMLEAAKSGDVRGGVAAGSTGAFPRHAVGR